MWYEVKMNAARQLIALISHPGREIQVSLQGYKNITLYSKKATFFFLQIITGRSKILFNPNLITVKHDVYNKVNLQDKF